MKIAVDFDSCASLGVCESLAPDYFEVGDDGLLHLKREDVAADDLALIEDAVNACPTFSLRVTS